MAVVSRAVEHNKVPFRYNVYILYNIDNIYNVIHNIYIYIVYMGDRQTEHSDRKFFGCVQKEFAPYCSVSGQKNVTTTGFNKRKQAE